MRAQLGDVAAGGGVATVLAPAGKQASGYALFRINPQTLRRTLLVHIS